MLTTALGIPTNFELTPANAHDIMVLEELIKECHQLIVVGTKVTLTVSLKLIF